MKDTFCACWICCLDESMSKWINKWTCPGFVFCPRKPWPFGNEYHTIACVLTSIIFFVEMVEGKDRPTELGPQQHNDLGKTVGLMLRMTRDIWYSSRVVVLDSGFCVLKGIIEMAKRGVFAAAVIKKRRYWPKYVPGDRIKEHFNNKPIGSVDALHGELDDTNFHIFCMKEEDYVMMLMSTYGTLEEYNETHRIVNAGARTQDRLSFRYTEVFHNHFKGRHAVDDNNKQRMQPIALEETWDTIFWENRVFSFFLGLSAANAQYGHEYFGEHPKVPVLKFRQKLAYQLIHNIYMPPEMVEEEQRRSKRKKTTDEHHCELTHLPAFRKFQGAEIVASASQYPKKSCFCKKTKVRTYCTCTPGTLLCKECYIDHVLAVQHSHRQSGPN